MITIQTHQLNIWYGSVHAIKDVTLTVNQHEVLGIIGPANSGKTTFLRSLNRLNDLNPSFKIKGSIHINGIDIYASHIDVTDLRKRIGIVFALPMPLPMSIYDNVVYGPRRSGIKARAKLDSIVEQCLKEAYLWDEVKDRLTENAANLSGGQQQRLCIARTLAVGPEIILFDEPCSGLDPISTGKVEDALGMLKKKYTIVLVTNNTKQAARVSDRVAFFLMGELVEVDETKKIFTVPRDKRTEEYVSGKFG